MSTLSIGIQDLWTSAAQKLDFSDSNVDDDSSRDSGIYMEEYSPSSVKPAGFRGLFSQEIEDQDSLVEHKLNDESPLGHQAERRRDRTCGIKRKLHDNDTVRAKKSTMDYSILQNTIKSAVERTETERDWLGIAAEFTGCQPLLVNSKIFIMLPQQPLLISSLVGYHWDQMRITSLLTVGIPMNTKGVTSPEP